MARMETKAQVLAALREELARWEGLLDSLSEGQIVAPQLDDGWSVKDVVAHLWAWQQRSIARLEAARLGREPAYPAWPSEFAPEQEEEPHDLNAWLYAASRDRAWAEMRRAWGDGFRRFLDLGEALPEGHLLEVGRYEWLEGYALIDVLRGSLEHHREHAEYLAPALDGLRRAS
jgi:hypothetical protein